MKSVIRINKLYLIFGMNTGLLELMRVFVTLTSIKLTVKTVCFQFLWQKKIMIMKMVLNYRNVIGVPCRYFADSYFPVYTSMSMNTFRLPDLRRFRITNA